MVNRNDPPAPPPVPHIATPVPTPVPPVPPVNTASHGSLTMTSRLSHPYITPGSTDLFVTVDVTGAEVPGSEAM